MKSMIYIKVYGGNNFFFGVLLARYVGVPPSPCECEHCSFSFLLPDIFCNEWETSSCGHWCSYLEINTGPIFLKHQKYKLNQSKYILDENPNNKLTCLGTCLSFKERWRNLVLLLIKSLNKLALTEFCLFFCLKSPFLSSNRGLIIGEWAQMTVVLPTDMKRQLKRFTINRLEI